MQADFAVCAFGVNDVLAVVIAIEEDVLNFQRRAAGNINHNVVMVGLYTAGVAHPQAGVLGVGVALRNGFTAHADGVGVLGTPGADQTQIFADGQHLVQWDGDLAGKIDRSAICGRGDSGFQLCPACDGILGGGTGCVVERDFLNGEIIGKGAYFSGNFRVGIAVGFFIFRQFA